MKKLKTAEVYVNQVAYDLEFEEERFIVNFKTYDADHVQVKLHRMKDDMTLYSYVISRHHEINEKDVISVMLLDYKSKKR